MCLFGFSCFVLWEDFPRENRDRFPATLRATSSWVFYRVASNTKCAVRLAVLRFFAAAAGGGPVFCTSGAIPRVFEKQASRTEETKIEKAEI